MLGDVSQARALDLCAGTGALALEALSRGASSAVLVERARPALAAIARNVAALGVSARTRVIAAPVERALAAVRRHAPYDLVFCDPPWSASRAVGGALSEWPWEDLLAERGRLALEHPAASPPELAATALVPDRTRAWGDTAFTVYLRRDAPGAGSRG